MFGSLGRRLALFNIAIVIAVVAVTGLATWVLLRQSLEHEANSVLDDRIDAVKASLGETPDLSSIATGPLPDTTPDRDHDDHDDLDLLKSGDVLVFIMDPDGRVVSSPGGFDLTSVPVRHGLRKALKGDKSTETAVISGEHVRVRTEPIEHHDRIYGAIQALRSERQHNAELQLVGLVSLGGVAFGIIVAFPAGLWLTRRALRPIEDAFQRQRSFIADASHELRTPLALLRANTELVARSPELTPEQRHDELLAILGEIDDMTSLVNTLLDLSRIEADPQPTLGPTPLRPAISRVLRELQPHAKQGALTISTDIPDISAIANEEILSRILRVLLENAIAYTPAGGAIHISATATHSDVMISVRDTGPGIAVEDRPYVFERFYRSRATSHGVDGAGLGLAIARALVQTLRGSIHLDPATDTGTTMIITLPRA